MRITTVILLTISLIFMLAAAACPSGDTDSQTQTPSPEPETLETPDVPAESLPLQITGTDMGELFDEWEALGEDTKLLIEWIGDPEVDLMEIIEWHIMEIAEGDVFTHEVDLDSGTWIIQAFGGTGIVDLDLAIYSEESGDTPLDENTLVDNFPLVAVILEDPETISIEVEPVEFEEDIESAFYCIYVI